MNGYFERDKIICILQIVTLYNAVILGWSVRRINNNTYELTRQLNGAGVNIKEFMEKIVSNSVLNL